MKHICLALALLAAAAMAAPDAPGSAPVTDDLRRTAVVKAVETAAPAVVFIGTERIIVARRDPFYRLFGDMAPRDPLPARRYKQYGLGSGVIIDPDGYIVTNEHVIRQASSIHVSLANSDTMYTARPIASHPEHDIAVIKIEPEAPLPHVEFADSDTLMLGEPVIAIGNPYGLENSVTTGVISATRRSITRGGKVIFKDFIQTDAAINPGNSGGALVDIHGRLVGINTSMLAAENIGFAIPVNKVKQSLEMLLDPRQLKQLWVGLVLSHDQPDRCAVVSVDKDSPAQTAGLKPGDLIVGMDGRPVCSAYEYDLHILKKSAGDTVTFTIERDGKRKQMTVTLAAVPRPSGTNLARSLFGLEVRDLTADDADRLEVKLDGGVLVTGVEAHSPAADKRLRKGDVIVRVDRYSVPTTEHLGLLLEHAKTGKEVLVWIVRDQYLIGNYLEPR